MANVSELYLRAIKYALAQGLTAKDTVCTWNLGGYRWVFNGKRETSEGIPFASLGVFNAAGWPVFVGGPHDGVVIGDLEAEDRLIAMLKEAQPDALNDMNQGGG